MALFDDFADFLGREETEKQKATDAKQRAVRQARQEFDSLFRQTFALISEYYTKILAPRRELFLIFKKSTDLEKPHSPYFLHRVNFIAQDSVPLGIDLRYVANPYLMPEKITQHDWHTNVALQISLFLEKTGSGFTLVFSCLVWGEIDSRFPANQSLTISSQEKSHLPYSEISFSTKDLSEAAFLALVEEVLTGITANVLSHRKVVWSMS